MRFAIDCGHNCPPYDTGAVGIKKEDDLVRAIGDRLIAELTRAGHECIDCTPLAAENLAQSLNRRVLKANSRNADIYISLHFNKFLPGGETTSKAMGTEIYALSNAAAAIAKPILKNLVNLGFVSRGIKSAPFAVLKNTFMPAILIEVCFLDSVADMATFDKAGAAVIANAIASGLIGAHQERSTKRAGTLKIIRATCLKPSTQQAADLPPAVSIDIDTGEYSVVDWGFEEGHWWVEWPDKSKGDRSKHFIYGKFGSVN